MSEPNWAPLRAALPLEECDPWMWMGRRIEGDRVIEQYKHRYTRRYLNLDQGGQAWTTEMNAPGCVPWCAKVHEHREATYTAVRLELQAALEWALS